MALIKCPECGQMISDRAPQCPNCGYPIMKGNEAQDYDYINQQPVYYDEKIGGTKKWLYALIPFLLVTMIGGGAFYFFYYKNKQQEKEYQEQLLLDSIAKDRENSKTTITQAKEKKAQAKKEFAKTRATVKETTISSHNSPKSNYYQGFLIDPDDDYVNIRRGPSRDYDIAYQLSTFTEIYYKKADKKWLKVYDQNYNFLGYVYHDRVQKYY